MNNSLNEEHIKTENTSVDKPETKPDAVAETVASEDSQESVGESSYKDNYYLLYGNKENNYLDLDGTISLLQALGFDGGQLRQARNGKFDSQEFKAAEEEENSTQMYCSYCGAEISGIEYERLPDGRLRCTACSNTIVKSESEVQEIFDRVRFNMESFFGASINIPIHVEVLEERKLKNKLKCPISVVDDKSMLVLGAAVNDKKDYRIYIENGAPRISVIATFAHELTHIWQYINWDSKKGFSACSKEKRLLIYEGMAKWAEIQYLYLVGETAVARREEFITRNREDEYGIGFVLYDNQYPVSYEPIICNNSPFVKNGYPINF